MNNTIIEIIASSDLHHTEDIIKFLCQDLVALNPEEVYIILCLVKPVDNDRLDILNCVIPKLKIIRMNDLTLILKCFLLNKYKYHIFTKLIKKCFLTKTDEIYVHFSPRSEQRVARIIENLKHTKSVESILVNFRDNRVDSNSAVELLEESIASINLQSADSYCEELRKYFNDNNDFEPKGSKSDRTLKSDPVNEYIKSCEILGIDPDVYLRYI